MSRKKKALKLTEPRVFNPPPEGDMGRPMDAICRNDDCQHKAHIWISRETSWLGDLAECPECGSVMGFDPSTLNITINARGAGAHSGTIGDRKKRMMKERSEKLAKKQWDNVEPIKIPEGRKVRNPTPGGPLDPNGPFVPKKREKKTFVPPKTSK